jgi:Predicted flavin-nucleotide-binding protein
MRRKDREVIEEAELREILEEADVCRLALSAEPAPYIVPLNFGFSWEGDLELYFHSAAEGRKIDLMKSSGKAGFELDLGHELVVAESACGWSMKYRSIIGWGEIGFIASLPERRKAMAAIMAHYGYAGEPSFDEALLGRMSLYKLVVREISGKQKK